MEPETGLWISGRPSWIMPPWQCQRGSELYLEPKEVVQLCRSLRFLGAYLYYAAAEPRNDRIGAAAIIKSKLSSRRAHPRFHEHHHFSMRLLDRHGTN